MSIGNIRKDICRSPKKRTWILVGLIPYPPKGAKNTNDAWHNTIHMILSALREFDSSGPSLEWDCADGFRRRCFPLLAAWVGDYPEHVMIARVSYGSCPICEIPKGAPMGHSGQQRTIYNLRDQETYSELLDHEQIDELMASGVRLFPNMFWHYPLCNVYRLWQPDELHQLYLGLVKDLFDWLLKYLKVRNLKDRFYKHFTSVPW